MFICKNYKKEPTFKLGFTLIELLVVIVIIGILATLTTITVTGVRANARDARRISDLKQIATALELYQADNNSYPTLITGGNALVNPNDASKVYMKKVPTNPTPRAEGACADIEYGYSGSTSDFSLIGCLAKGSGDAPAGARLVSVGGEARNLGPTNGVVAWWMLDDTFTVGNLIRDAITGSSFATSSGATLASNQLGMGNKAYSLTNGGTINLPFQSVVNYSGDYTISFWYKKAESGGVGFDNLYLNRTSSVDEVGINIYNAGNQLVFFRYNGVQNFIAKLFDAGVWNHVVAISRSNVIEIYMNNVKGLVTAGSITGLPYGTDNSAYLKTVSNNVVNSVSDFRIYNRALSTVEITTLFDATRLSQ